MGGRKVKKGTRGDSAMFITRAQALKRLQVSLADFRRLCILKGIYPREPKKKLQGLDKTYYHSKDITHLKFDPILSKVRDLKIYLRKYRKALGRNDRTKARTIKENKPIITLQHIVKERYPCLVDALRDIDDALSTCTLFASLGADDNHNIPSSIIKRSAYLIDEFMYLVSECGFLTKSFISIKGFYFQANILGVTITWLLPHQFTQEIPDEVDFKVMTTFLEFYLTLLKFVNFKLYQLNNMTYPPSLNKELFNSGGRFLSFHSYNLSRLNNIKENIELEKNNKNLIFQNLTFFISREVPLIPLAFVIRSLGGKVGWESDYSLIKEGDEQITHYIVDRPINCLKKFLEKYSNCEFIQPQWIFDSMNESIRLPIHLYYPGEKLPPHLSPFVDDKLEGYIPTQREVLDGIKNSIRNIDSISSDETTHVDDLSQNESDVELQQAKEDAYFESIEKEQFNINKNNFENKESIDNIQIMRNSLKSRKKEEQREQQKALLSKKHRRLLQRIEYTNKIKSEKAQRLESRKINNSKK